MVKTLKDFLLHSRKTLTQHQILEGFHLLWKQHNGEFFSDKLWEEAVDLWLASDGVAESWAEYEATIA
jgi:hypothetical protein